MARHLPFHRREDHPPPRRAGGPEARLHHPRRRRPDPSAQAAAGGGGHRREALARARAGRPHRQLEEPRPHARPGARRGGRELRRGQGQEALHRVSGTAEGAQRRRFRRPAARMHPAVPRAARGAAPVPGPLPLHPGGRISGYERGAVSVAALAGAEHEFPAVIAGLEPAIHRFARDETRREEDGSPGLAPSARPGDDTGR